MTKTHAHAPARSRAEGRHRRARQGSLAKAATGIKGLDEMTNGGLPRRRATLVCGGPGSGKTLLATQFLVHGALQQDEPGVFMSFEEPPGELAENSRSLGYDLEELVARRKLLIDYVRVERSEIVESGGYDLDGLFIRMAHAIDSIRAKRVVLDTVEMLFSGLSDTFALRAELHRLFQWLKKKGVTTIVTCERGNEGLTRHGLEEYLTDCVIVLDQRVANQEATRRLRILKYRGSAHSNNEFPFLIDNRGLSVLPITAMQLEHEAPTDRVSSGIPALDDMLAGAGYFRGSSVLVSGTSGTGKSSIAAHFAAEACRRGDRCLYLALEESPGQIVRNMRSIGLDLEPAVRRNLLRIHAQRPTALSLEAHLVAVHRLIDDDWAPHAVVMDPISNLISVGSELEVKLMLARLLDFMKTRNVTAVTTALTAAGEPPDQTDIGISSLMDVWMVVQNVEANGERNRVIQIVKARGIAHSNQIREFVLTSRGVKVLDPYRQVNGRILVGSAREADQVNPRTGTTAPPGGAQS
jgi:circadian clock protein KaiC